MPLQAIFIRGLCEAFVRNEDSSDFAILIHSYVDVQVGLRLPSLY